MPNSTFERAFEDAFVDAYYSDLLEWFVYLDRLQAPHFEESILQLDPEKMAILIGRVDEFLLGDEEETFYGATRRELLLLRAILHKNGVGAEKDYQKGKQCYEAAIIRNDPDAMIQRALLYINGLGERKNYVAAIQLLKRAGEITPRALPYLAQMRMRGQAGDVYFDKTQRILEKAKLRGFDTLTYQEELERLRRQQWMRSKELDPFYEKFDDVIAVLHQKMVEFKHRRAFMTDAKLQEAYTAANVLYNELKELGEQFFSLTHPTLDQYQAFQSACQQKTQEARIVLEEHRGWVKPLLNMILNILTLGLIFMKNKETQTQKGTFFSTNSSKILDILEKKMKQLTEEHINTSEQSPSAPKNRLNL